MTVLRFFSDLDFFLDQSRYWLPDEEKAVLLDGAVDGWLRETYRAYEQTELRRSDLSPLVGTPITGKGREVILNEKDGVYLITALLVERPGGLVAARPLPVDALGGIRHSAFHGPKPDYPLYVDQARDGVRVLRLLPEADHTYVIHYLRRPRSFVDLALDDMWNEVGYGAQQAILQRAVALAQARRLQAYPVQIAEEKNLN